MKKRLWAAMAAAALINTPALANEGRVFWAGSVEVAGNKKTNVAMREEEIIITLHKDGYEIDVSFKFYNDGADEKILTGFPVVLWGSFNDEDIEEAHDALLNVKSYVNGKPFSPKQYTVKEDMKYDVGGYRRVYTRWFLREIEFKGKSYTETRVVYKMPYTDRGEYAGYTYGTGRTWKGPIGKMTIIVDHPDDIIVGGVYMSDSLLNPLNHPNKGKAKFSWDANGRYRYVLENVNPKTKDDQIKIYISPFRSLYGKYDGEFECRNEFGVFFCPLDYVKEYRSSSWHWDAALLYKDPDEISLFTKNQIRLFINFFFARHGYDFKNPLYKEYFQKQVSDAVFWSGWNYKVNPDFKEKDFNGFERKNIDYLLKMEKMIPVKGGNVSMDKPGIVTASPPPPAVSPPDASSNPDSIAMVLIEGGTFTMGCTPEQYCYDESDAKAHKVTLSGFYIGKYEVTQGLWKSVTGSNPSYHKGDDNLPVDNVLFDDVQAFILKLNAKTGKKYRLPTEAEWEYAARGGRKSKGYKYSGGISHTHVAWYLMNSEYKTYPVGTKRANELGIYDMSGNVWEWVSGWYEKYGPDAQTNPSGPPAGSERMIRGGSYHDDDCRVAYRQTYPERNDNIGKSTLGFRLVLDP